MDFPKNLLFRDIIFLEVCCLISYYLEIFQLSFCCWFPVLFHLVWEHTLYDLYYFKFVKVYFMTHNVDYFGKCSMWAWGKCVLLDEALYRCQLDPINWWCYSVQQCPYVFSVCWIWKLLIEGVKYWCVRRWGLQLCLWIYPSLSVSSVLASCNLKLYCLAHTHLGLLCLLGGWSHRYTMPLVISSNFLCLMST